MATGFQVDQHEPAFSFAPQCAAAGKVNEGTHEILWVKSNAYAKCGIEPIHCLLFTY